MLVPSTSYQEALLDLGYKKAIDEEMTILHHNQTWNLTTLPLKKQVTSCHWVYAVKFLPDGWVEWLKTRLVAKGYTQTFRIDYFETSSMAIMCMFFGPWGYGQAVAIIYAGH